MPEFAFFTDDDRDEPSEVDPYGDNEQRLGAEVIKHLETVEAVLVTEDDDGGWLVRGINWIPEPQQKEEGC